MENLWVMNHESKLKSVLTKYWGFEDFLPMQLDAMKAVMNDRDSLCVFPTGGGKSLCFQAPSLCKHGLGVVVSPLISLMKDQIDSLRACGVNAAFLNSSLSGQERKTVTDQIQSGEQRLIYAAPESLLTESTLALLKSTHLSFIAIDEAHCVSEWGHDFRPKYRQLKILKNRFPNVAIHAYTATATEQVRHDIVHQLALSKPEILIGSVDRPNLTYQIRRRRRGIDQVVEVLNKHSGESGIVYCITRKDVEAKCTALNNLGFSALPYHAGLTPDIRKHNQERFLQEDVDIIVATVAFGMGIDKSNVRYVIHASMPKSLEAYQQESGRAGRDGLDAECWMFFNSGDFVSWKRLVEQSESQQSKDGALQSLYAISNFCNDIECRHVALAAHFGEHLELETCEACDVCLDQLDLVSEPLVLAQKIVSCVFRVDQGFGGDYVSKVLSGSPENRIRNNGHDKLSTFGLLGSENRKDIRTWIDQLISQGFLVRSGEYNVIKITEKGNQLLRGDVAPKLTKAVGMQETASSSKIASWEGVDRGLFAELREVRKTEATDRGVPAFVVFSDASLRDMARCRPSTKKSLREVHGVGDQRLVEYGEKFVEVIGEYCNANGISQDAAIPSSRNKSPKAHSTFSYFDQGMSLKEVADKVGRTLSTTQGYLEEYIKEKIVVKSTRWVDESNDAKIRDAAKRVGFERLKPIFEELSGKISYDEIRIVLLCLENEESGPN